MSRNLDQINLTPNNVHALQPESHTFTPSPPITTCCPIPKSLDQSDPVTQIPLRLSQKDSPPTLEPSPFPVSGKTNYFYKYNGTTLNTHPTGKPIFIPFRIILPRTAHHHTGKSFIPKGTSILPQLKEGIVISMPSCPISIRPWAPLSLEFRVSILQVYLTPYSHTHRMENIKWRQGAYAHPSLARKCVHLIQTPHPRAEKKTPLARS